MSSDRLKIRPDVQVFSEVAIIDQLSSARIERLLPAGLSHPQFSVLRRLAQSGGKPLTPADLSASFQVSKGAMTNTLQRLEARGLILVLGDAADGRRKRVSITAAGWAALDEGVAALRPMMESLREAFTDAEFADALPFLRALRAWLEETR